MRLLLSCIFMATLGLLCAGQTRPAATTPAASEPAADFYGVQAPATRIVYIVDHSGSMLDNFDFVRKEVDRSVGRLVPLQFFGVVMVSEKATSVMGNELVRALPENKKKFSEALAHIRAEGQNDDMLPPFQQAFEVAFKLKPQMIYFLTDGRFGKGLPGVIAKLNADHKVVINTVAFVSEEPEYKAVLKRIAKENGGKYVFVPEKTLKGK